MDANDIPGFACICVHSRLKNPKLKYAGYEQQTNVPAPVDDRSEFVGAVLVLMAKIVRRRELNGDRKCRSRIAARRYLNVSGNALTVGSLRNSKAVAPWSSRIGESMQAK